MSVLSQTTISNKISLSGVGIHTGKNVNLNILPSFLIQVLYSKEQI